MQNIFILRGRIRDAAFDMGQKQAQTDKNEQLKRQKSVVEEGQEFGRLERAVKIDNPCRTKTPFCFYMVVHQDMTGS